MMTQLDLWEARTHSRTSDPQTSHDAAEAINITRQARRILSSYKSGLALLDVQAYQRAGFAPHACDGQRCSDLRTAGLIERTGAKAITPSGKYGYLCRITDLGQKYLRARETGGITA
jgi:hypothetical protein